VIEQCAFQLRTTIGQFAQPAIVGFVVTGCVTHLGDALSQRAQVVTDDVTVEQPVVALVVV
jgi:hypothetical protein